MKGGDKGREGREEGGISVKRSTVEHNTPTV